MASVQTLPLTHPNCVVLGKLPNLSGPYLEFSNLEIIGGLSSQGCGEDHMRE